MRLDERKAALRAQAAARRNAVHAAAGGAAEAARDRFLEAGLHRGAAVVSGYRPIRSELDPTPLILALAAAGCRLCLPVIQGGGLPLRFREWTPESRMAPGPYGAQVPEDGDWLEPDLLLVPLLAFDDRGHRLGYGGGFYDRTIAGLRARKPVLAVGFAYSAQQAEEVPTGEIDQPLDLILTEAGLIRPQLARRHAPALTGASPGMEPERPAHPANAERSGRVSA